MCTHIVLCVYVYLSLCVYIAVRAASAYPLALVLALPLGECASVDEALTPCSASCLTMQGKTGVSLPPTHSPCSTHTTLCTSLLRSSSLPLFLCCTSSIAHYGRFVNRSMCTIATFFICAGCIPCQLGPRRTCPAQRMYCVLMLCVYYIVHR